MTNAAAEFGIEGARGSVEGTRGGVEGTRGRVEGGLLNQTQYPNFKKK